MGDSLFGFLKSHPLWAVLIILFAILPVIGLILPLFRKAFGRRGVEQSPSPFEFSPGNDGKDTADDDTNLIENKDEEPSKEA
jgi:hypothetical protein